MRLPIFGRKGPDPAEAQEREKGISEGLDAMLLALEAQPESPSNNPLQRDMFRAILAINRLILKSSHVTRIEDVFGVLGATGGFSCIVAAMDYYYNSGQQIDREAMLMATDTDGQNYYFGDLPNQILLEHDASFLSLTFGLPEMPLTDESRELVRDVFEHVAGSIGQPDFGMPWLPAAHRPADLPINYVKQFWPPIRAKLEACNVPISQRPATLGFAVQHVLTVAEELLDRQTATQIVVEYAVPMAKIDPAKFG